MIKKIIFITIILVLCMYPIAFANDGGIRPDTERLSFECTLKSHEVKIGEPFEFTLKITNNTSRVANLFSIQQIFRDSYYDSSTDFDEIVIDPYSTVTIDFSCTVPSSIDWYQKNGEYYTDFYPEFYYIAKNLLDSEEKDEWYNEENDYWDYYQTIKKPIPCKITNLKDGSNYASISVIDDKNIIGFSDSAYKVSASWNGELVSEHVSYLNIQNNCNASLENVYVYQQRLYGNIGDITLKTGESSMVKHSYRKLLTEENIPQELTIEYKTIFNLNSEYYCTSTSRTYTTKIYDVPKINVIVKKVYDENTDDYRYTYLIENNTDNTYENFAFFYSDDYEFMSSYEKYGEYMQSGTFHPNEVWHFPMSFSSEALIYFFIGFIEDGTFYYRSFSSFPKYEEDLYDGKVYVLTSVGECEQEIVDVYSAFNDITVNYPTTEANPYPTSDSTSLALPYSFSPAPTALNTPTPSKTSEVVVKDRYYIPPYIFAALIFFLLVIILILVIKLKNGATK